MFCKNCGREIDQKTLEKLMRPSGESATCPNCGEEVDTAEFCGGFWGLVASSEAMQGGNGENSEPGAGQTAGRKGRKAVSTGRKSDRTGQQNEDISRRSGRVPGVTEADRMLARMILEEDGSRDAAGIEKTGRGEAGAGLLAADPAAGHAAGRSDQKAGGSEKMADGSGKKADGSVKKADGSVKKADGSGKKADSSVKKAGDSGRGTSRGNFRPVAAALLAAAVLVGFLAGRFIPFSSGGGKTGTAGTEQTAEGPGGEGTDAQTAGNLNGEDADAQEDSLAQADDGTADSQAGEDILSTQEKEGAGNTSNVETGTVGNQSGSSPENVSGPAGTEGDGYNMIRATLKEVDGLLIEDSVLYYGSQDSGIIFDGKTLRNEQLTGAGGIAYVKTDIEESQGTLTELNRVYYDKNGDEINNPSGYSRVKYEYDDQGALERKKYYAMIEGLDKDTKICTAECEIRESGGSGESGEENVSVEIFEPSDQAADYEAFRYKKTERTFMSQDSELPGALRTVRYFLQESDLVPAREEVHEYSRVDKTASEEEADEYDYYVEETIRVFVSKEAGEEESGNGGISAAWDSTATTAETASSDNTSDNTSENAELQETAETAAAGSTSEAAGFGESAGSAEMASSVSTSEAADSETSSEAFDSVMTDLITIRYYFEEDDDQPGLVRMGFYQDGNPAEGKAGYSGFIRSYSAGGTVREDLFFGTGGKTETGDTDPAAFPEGEDADPAAFSGSDSSDSAAFSGSDTSDPAAFSGSDTSDSAVLPDGDTSDSAARSGGEYEESAVLLGSEDPLLAGEAVPGFYTAENPWFFLIP